MKNVKESLWELRHEDEIWTKEGGYVGIFDNPEYPRNSSIAAYIVELHNAQIDQLDNSIDYVDHHNFFNMTEEESS